MIKLLSLLISILLPFVGYADDQAASNEGPIETWNCVLNEGKILDDVRAVGAMVADVAKEAEDPIAQWLFTPFTGDMQAGRFVLMTGWPGFPSMGSSFGNFFTEPEDSSIANSNYASSCYIKETSCYFCLLHCANTFTIFG